MTTASIPAAKVMQLHAAINAAMKLADAPRDVDTWIALSAARAIVEVYLVSAMQPVGVNVTESEVA